MAMNTATRQPDPPAAYRVRVPDDAYWREQIKCQTACPVHTDARGYVRAIADGDFEAAYLIARGPNPLASICGRICGAPCEANCRRKDIDAAVSIRALKRFVTAEFGSESGTWRPRELMKQVIAKAEGRDCAAEEELAILTGWLRNMDLRPPTGESIGIVGSGPAGLACAHDLALMGYRPVIYEMEPVPAGMLALGVPSYRLPRELIQAEVEVIRALGVDIRCNVRVGVDVKFAELRRHHKAVVIAVGAKKSRRIPIPGCDAPEVLGGVEFLRDVALGRPVELGRRIVVIGGGNVAFDVSRTVIRQAGGDIARTALRQTGVRDVALACLESIDEMPADDVEIIEGNEEGVHLNPSLGPMEIHTDAGGHVTGVTFKRCLRVFDETGKFAPVFDETDTTHVACDTVIWAVGQGIDVSFLDEDASDIERDARGLVVADPETLRTSAEDVWLAGDVAYGPRLMIDAIASGKKAARSIYAALTGVTLHQEHLVVHFPIPGYDREADYEKLTRTDIPTRPADERKIGMDREVELGYHAVAAVREGCRCLDCGVNTIFDGTRCVLCGGCVDVCPSECLRIVPLSAVEGDEGFAQTRDGWLREAGPEPMSAILKDETLCIRCGLCAERCPNDAITMERFRFEGGWREQPAW